MIDTQKKETDSVEDCGTNECCTSDCKAVTEVCESYDNESDCKDDSNWEKKVIIQMDV